MGVYVENLLPRFCDDAGDIFARLQQPIANSTRYYQLLLPFDANAGQAVGCLLVCAKDSGRESEGETDTQNRFTCRVKVGDSME